jgi:hypothetical protein
LTGKPGPSLQTGSSLKQFTELFLTLIPPRGIKTQLTIRYPERGTIQNYNKYKNKIRINEKRLEKD